LGDPVDREAILTRYGLRPDRPVLLISAGAAGGAYTQTIVQQTLRMRNEFQAFVACGRNDQLKSQIEGLVAFNRDRYRVLGYTNDMPDLMRTASLFIGKPGGLTSSECMAAGLPMVLIHPIPGQEVRNSDFLLEEGAAVRCNYETTVGYKIDQLLAEPDASHGWPNAPGGSGDPTPAHTSPQPCLMMTQPRCGSAKPLRNPYSPPASGVLRPRICMPAVGYRP
jgi:processive 1,2-diacylglycerol beta-glucosyltransferase